MFFLIHGLFAVSFKVLREGFAQNSFYEACFNLSISLGPYANCILFYPRVCIVESQLQKPEGMTQYGQLKAWTPSQSDG